MFDNLNVKTVIKVIVLLSFMLAGIFFYKIYQPQSKTIQLYQQGLKNYENANYQNAYYLFSRVGYSSKLKPAALYRQALCAKSLGDKISEYKSYTVLFKYFPNSKFSKEAKYNAAQILIDRDSELALKYFKKLLKSSIDSEHKIAAGYYVAKISSEKIAVSKINLSEEEKNKIERYYRTYLAKYPKGRFAVDAARCWENFNPNLSSADLTLIAKVYYLSGDYEKAEEILQKTDIKDSWIIQTEYNIAINNMEKANELLLQGVALYDIKGYSSDYLNAIEKLLGASSKPLSMVVELLEKSKVSNREFLYYKKCDLSDAASKQKCLNELYAKYPDGKYSKYALENLFDIALKNKDYNYVKKIEEDYVTRFPNSEKVPMMMFWRAKLEQRYFYNPEFQIFYRNIINNYPDSYYAYRSFWILQNFKNSVVSTNLKYEPIEYPYKYPSKSDILYSLILVKDYDLIKKMTDDEFIKSWCLYRQGRYSESAHRAKIAMDKLKIKPPKTDVRWRLVYPLNYYNQVQNNAKSYSNNIALILSVIREESYFNAEAQSGVGAIGLMQLMPATAHEIGERNSYIFDTRDLFNSELNIKLGNMYFASLLSQLNGDNMLAVASYNGGIGSVQRWLKNLKSPDFDEFVEQIPYDETRNYVKKIFRSYWNYTRIYQN